MSLVPARNGANAPPARAADFAQEPQKTSTKGKVPTGYAEEIVISEQSFRNLQRDVQSRQAAGHKRKRETKGDSSVVYGAAAYKGPWAKYEEKGIDSDSGEEIEVEVEEDDESSEEVVYEEDAIAPVPAKGKLQGTAYAETGEGKETSVFEGSTQYDYQGRTYMHVPQDLDMDLTSDFENLSLKCYHPKKQVYAFRPQSSTGNKATTAHDKAINTIRFFPNSGHLLLSASADSKAKLWDVYHDRELLRSYSGHTKSIVDTDFSPDGTRFITASYDRQMKVWDTETGACLGRFSTGSTPHVVRWQPDDRSGVEFVAGMHDNKIVQFDTRIPPGGEGDKKNPVQEYDHHLGPVNTITFCDENRRFITTSDDKSLRAWEYNIPVPIKFIAEPYMFPMVASVSHPTKPSILLQSSDNTIKVYNTGEKIRQNRKKDFRGHNCAGYKIDVDVSPDGGIVCSGDSGGFVCFWDFKTCKMWHKIKASEKSAVVAVAWHPRESSKVVTGDLDGNMKYWD